jgi:hypothetical protein
MASPSKEPEVDWPWDGFRVIGKNAVAKTDRKLRAYNKPISDEISSGSVIEAAHLEI